ncbi:hypothetical protein DL89DRAFT_284379 [Linderina pennispora]|uniref:Extracellular metalloproteinase n=1 Tax=Linderina pennispora TaxID=61395 RepID=A0A1Y1W674_9FUNG|nr:uncharacterized protein DL89DRAFT_284379 [Linderina pennispora]ORX69029.1 hypothetical protein DL89DRAFT_284379 [Linderina pennispora]
MTSLSPSLLIPLLRTASFVGNTKKDSAVKSKADIAVAYLAKNHNIPAQSIKVTDAYTDARSGGGVDVANGLANVNVDSKGRIISSSQSFASADALSKRASDDASLKNAFKSLNDYVKTAVSDSDLSKITVASTASPCWRTPGSIEAINDWVSHAESYNVYPRNVNDPLEGSRSIVSSPANTNASPKGWVTGTTTTGNNVWAQNNPTGGSTWKNNHRPNLEQRRLQLPAGPDQGSFLFYTVNTMHDLSFLYGFTEAAAAVVLAATMSLPMLRMDLAPTMPTLPLLPDGQNGVMRMYTWTQTNPNRDGDLEQDIVAHEFTHGISNRLTGGPSNTNCLNDGEAGGMGEGWSDTVANLMRLKSGNTRSRDLLLGQYVYGQGIRNYPYSTSTSTNPSTYGYLDDPNYQEVHAIGEVWAEILYEVIWNLIDANGMAADLFSHDLTKGNSIALQIILDGMKLQPCNPTFIDARDAIIQAEQNLTGGKNKCAIWKGFAKRGLGVNASSDWWSHTEDYTVPSGC